MTNKFDVNGDLVEDVKEAPEEQEQEFYSLDRIKELKCQYNLIFGKRSNGKTYAVLYEGVKNYVERGKQMAYLRRYREDFVGKRGQVLFNSLVSSGAIKEITSGKWDSVKYMSSQWFLAKKDPNKDGKMIIDSCPFCYGFSLGQMEHDKSTSYPDVTTIVFDEFISRIGYIPNEFVLFMNVLSTIIRQRDDVKIYMLGNTVNKYCPYFAEMGLKNVATMQQGAIDIYQFGDTGAKVAVEYAETVAVKKPSNKYFCFDNQNLQMITSGKWELAAYPHLQTKYRPKDVIFVFYIVFNDNILQGNVVNDGENDFIFIHPKTTEIKDTENSLIYSLECNSRPNYRRRLLSNITEIDKKITKYFAMDKVFYQSNEVGELVRNYIKISSVNNLVS